MGQIAHEASAIMATVAVVSGLIRPRWHRPILGASLVLLTIAAGQVVLLLIREDTSYEIVTNHTRPGLDVTRRVMGLWGGSAGSLLLFTLLIGWILFTAPVMSHLRIARSFTLAVLAWASVLIASPFERLANPAIAGSGLSPILEHWAMIIHPPLLYVGLGLSLVPAVVDVSAVRRWSASALGFLTVALALGGGWAYVELGWGGWWAWDPVENAALIPWLLLAASLHVAPNSAPARWATLLVWPTVFAGTAMTRTSLRTSVHAFANGEQLAWVLWPLTAVLSVAALAYGFATIDHTRIPRRRVLPTAVLLSSAVIVAFGTFRPFIPGDATDGAFYARFLFPVAVVGLVGIGVAPRLRRTNNRRLITDASVGAIIALAAASAVGWTTWWQLTLGGSIGIALATTIGTKHASPDRTLAHLGMILVLAGALGGTASTTRTFPLEVQESRMVVGHSIVNSGVGLTQEDPPVITATIEVDGVELQPALTVYAERRLRLPEVATRRRFHEDVQIILRSADDDGSVTITVNVEPLTQFVWLGASLITFAMVIVGVRAQSDRFSRRAFRSSATVAEDAGAAAGTVADEAGVSSA